MSDLISRQAAIALADTLKDNSTNNERIADAVAAHNVGILEYQTALSLLPSAQPEIIRCKDCRHWKEQGLCEIWDHYISNSEFYCGCAERKTDEN